MPDPVAAIQTAADTVNAFNAFTASVIAILPTIGYAMAFVAAFLPPPVEQNGTYYWIHRLVNFAACNFRRAKNASGNETP
jgi:hypothetical protein